MNKNLLFVSILVAVILLAGCGEKVETPEAIEETPTIYSGSINREGTLDIVFKNCPMIDSPNTKESNVLRAKILLDYKYQNLTDIHNAEGKLSLKTEEFKTSSILILDTCTLTSGFLCNQFGIIGKDVYISIKNGMGRTIIFKKIELVDRKDESIRCSVTFTE